ncbi:MAG: 3-deoxy-7-phosphoheptulonate synthase [Candidatus Dormibacteraeota bacterium]|nr:3-deoxy-7-phosphoheptulonate synthase [Candidatus Dormibacteraeota bacterium]
MLILMNVQATPAQVQNVCDHVRERGFVPVELPGADRLAIGVLGSNPSSIRDAIVELPGVVDAVPVSKPYKQVTREWHPEATVVDVSGVRIGDGSFSVIAGPCAVESREQLINTAQAVHRSGAAALRGGAFKPRTSPYSFRGLGEAGLAHLVEARRLTGLPFVTEVLTPSDVHEVAEHADMLQVGTRNAQNFSLLEAVGDSGKPVLLKRGLSNTIEEWLLSAEYIVSRGNPAVVLCERGIRTFEAATRNTLDLSAVPVAKSLSHLPVVVDPSHATGHRHLVPPMALAALAAGADGLLIEVHPDPDNALSDGPQSLSFAMFDDLMDHVGRMAAALDRKVATAPSQVALPSSA